MTDSDIFKEPEYSADAVDLAINLREMVDAIIFFYNDYN
jgi:hypothetical protein